MHTQIVGHVSAGFYVTGTWDMKHAKDWVSQTQGTLSRGAAANRKSSTNGPQQLERVGGILYYSYTQEPHETVSVIFQSPTVIMAFKLHSPGTPHFPKNGLDRNRHRLADGGWDAIKPALDRMRYPSLLRLGGSRTVRIRNDNDNSTEAVFTKPQLLKETLHPEAPQRR